MNLLNQEVLQPLPVKLTVVHWSDNKDVQAISTLYSDSLTTVRRQVDAQRKDVHVSCPDNISDYNSFLWNLFCFSSFSVAMDKAKAYI